MVFCHISDIVEAFPIAFHITWSVVVHQQNENVSHKLKVSTDVQMLYIYKAGTTMYALHNRQD